MVNSLASLPTLTLGPAANAALQNGGPSTAAAIGGGSRAGGASSTAAQTPFAGVLENALQKMGQLETDAAAKVDGVLSGSGVDVHAAMIATERSDLAFEMALAVRSKAVSAYEQLNSMQF